MNILDELVRVGAFVSKNEARTMIKNKGVSIIPCLSPYDVPTCFRDIKDEPILENTHVVDVSNWWHWNTPGKTWKIVNFKRWIGEVETIDGTKIPCELLDFSQHSIELNLNGKIGFKDDFVLKWDKEKFGKNPWLLTDDKLDCILSKGDTIQIGKKRTIIVE